MPRTSATVSISLPPEMAKEIERVRKREHRTRSELVREALRCYISDAARRQYETRVAALAEEEPTTEELRAIAESDRQMRLGRFRTLRQIADHVYGPHKQSRRKKP